MLVYGKNVARELLKGSALIKSVTVSKDFNEEEILKLIKNKSVNLFYKDKNEMDKLCENNSQGILLDIKENFYIVLKHILDDEKANFIVMLDHIEDPHNFGAIIRTCECAGVDYIIVPNKGNVLVNSTVMKTSSGAVINSKICIVSNLNNAISSLKKNGFWIVGTDSKGEDYTKIKYDGKIVLVIGSEGKGLKEIVKKSCDFVASIPIKGKTNSLNASVATGIMIYEVLKTR